MNTKPQQKQNNSSVIIDDVSSFADESEVEIVEAIPRKPHVFVIHHSDADGWASAAIALSSMATNTIEMENFPTTYNKPFPFDMDLLHKEDSVFILDFSYKKEILEDIHKRVKSLVVLDHHESMREEIAHLPYVTFDTSKSGVLLAWDYFVDPVFVPPNIQLLDAYDLWNKNHPEHPWEDVVSFHLGCVPHMEELGFWMGVVNDFRLNQNILSTGRELYKDVKARAEELESDLLTNLFKIKGTDIFFCHNKLHISLVSDILYNDEMLNTPVTIMAYEADDGGWVLSVRSRKGCPLTALEVAQAFGGGGHVLAAGATIKEQIGQTDLEAYVVQVLKDKLG